MEATFHLRLEVFAFGALDQLHRLVAGRPGVIIGVTSLLTEPL